MKKDYILVIDSGIGGVSILKSLIKKMPNENFIYLADNKISPYGNKSKSFLTQNITNIIEKLLNKYSIKLIVFACNTLTATSIKNVRKRFKNLKFVGTEPPVKMVNKNEKTLVLATKGTISHSKLLKKYKNNKNFDFIALKDIAKLLDTNFFDREKIIDSLQNQILNKGYKNVVLGCTHYYFLKNELKFILNEDNIKFYSSVKGVTKRVENLLDKDKNYKGNIEIILTQKDRTLNETIKYLLND